TLTTLNLMQELPHFRQQVNCPTRDHCCYTLDPTYRVYLKAPLGNSDHTIILLIPIYKQKLKVNPPEAIESLKGCFECTDWNVFSSACASLDKYSDSVTSYKRFCEEVCIPTKTFKTDSYKKSWVSKELQDLRLRKNKTFIKGDRTEYISAKYELCSAVRKAKSNYSKQLEEQFADNSSVVWRIIQEMTNYKETISATLLDDDPNLPDKWNQFYVRSEK
uniref:Uncharacterized protein n=1 Tax=Lepisosteus oculatus TaxID=7918 RepID=W5NDT2_LEPOC